MPSITIIGTGLAGYNLAKEIRRFDAHIPITLITADTGEYYHKPQLSTGLAKFAADPAGLIMATAEEMAKNFNLQVMTHTDVKCIDTQNRQLIFSEGHFFPYEKLVLALGATPIKALLRHTTSQHITSVNNLNDYFAFREKIAGKSNITILGAGLVGCEFADDLVNAGYHVNVIAPSLTPLETLAPKAVGVKLQQVLTEKGVKWYLGQTAVDLHETTAGYRLTLSNGETLQTEYILTAIGIQPNVALAQKSGIHINKGIVVDEYLETNIEHIFALGDCAEVNGVVLPYIAPLQHCVKSLASILLDKRTPVDYPPMPITVKTPSLPIVTLPSIQQNQGDWEITADGNHITALLYDHEELNGFVLTGEKTKERMAWLKKIGC
jgi:rubredoxin-NAD+ reductase